jgi:sugar phosphate isomerase/epimerase
MLTGISTYTYTWAFGVPGSLPPKPMNVQALLDKAEEHGIDCVQIADNYPLIEQKPAELSAIRDYAANCGIGIEVGGRGLTEESLDGYIDLAVFFSSPILRMIVDGQDYQPDIKTIIAIIRNALHKLDSKNIILALENHDRLHSSVFKAIVEKIKNEKVGICLDCVNSMGIGEGIDSVIKNLGPYTVNLHVKDFTVRRVSHKMGFVIEGTPAGKGFLDVPLILQNLRSFHKCRSAILELWTPPAGSLPETISREDAWADESIQYLKKVITET